MPEPLRNYFTRNRVNVVMLLSDIPTDAFNRIIAELRADGWKKIKEYDGFDAWIDYGFVVLQKQGVRLTFEWDNWIEGSLEGPETQLQELKAKYALT